MKIGLVSLPWSIVSRPSAALGALKAYLAREAPELEVDGIYEYMKVSRAISPNFYNAVSNNAYEVGELLYAALLFPERRPDVLEWCTRNLQEPDAKWVGLRRAEVLTPTAFEGANETWAQGFERTIERLDARMDVAVAEIAGRYDVIGLTTCFGQLFANLTFAERLKRLSPGTIVVLGGSTLSGYVGASVLNEFQSVDFVVQGEGELPFTELLRRLAAGQSADDMKGVLTRGNAATLPAGASMWEVPNMDALPLPNYDEYAALAKRFDVPWVVPIEGSRGCWFDRTKRSGNPRSICHFCNLNVQWNGYREKTGDRLVEEVVAMTDRYETSHVFFLDNIMRFKGIEQFATRLEATGRDFSLFYEMRAHIHPYELLRLWEAGLDYVQFGIEGLSSSYLKRIGKGITTLQNLQAMKTCTELGIHNSANLLTNFPGGTAEEIEETRRCIQRYAYAYQPLKVCPFWLGSGSTVEGLQDEFPITAVRNRDFYRAAVPPDVYERMRFFDLSFDSVGDAPSWRAVADAVHEWQTLHAVSPAPERHHMYYTDIGSSMRIRYLRDGMRTTLVVKGVEREIYLFCSEIRSQAEIRETFPQVAVEELEALFEYWDGEGLIYSEGGRHLTLAPAESPKAAARRIRANHGRRKPAPRRTKSLEIVRA